MTFNTWLQNKLIPENKAIDHTRWELWLRSFFARRGLQVSDVDDLVQSVLVKIFRKSMNISETKIKAWVTTVAVNELNDFLRKKQRKKTVSQDPIEAENDQAPKFNMGDRLNTIPVETAIVEEEKEAVRKAMKELSSLNFEIIDLFYFKALSHAEIATKLNIPVGTVKSRLNAALSKLQSKLKNQ